MFWLHDLTGQSEQAGYLTWAFGDLTWGLVYCTREITLARMFFLAFGLNYDGSSVKQEDITHACYLCNKQQTERRHLME